MRSVLSTLQAVQMFLEEIETVTFKSDPQIRENFTSREPEILGDVRRAKQFMLDTEIGVLRDRVFAEMLESQQALTRDAIDLAQMWKEKYKDLQSICSVPSTGGVMYIDATRVAQEKLGAVGRGPCGDRP